jgi:NAD(P)-dependent dehydrogenase (short-subunit alcohol dehydrogenase family)
MPAQTIFITGAASGIGRATALRFAREGWRVGAFDLDLHGLESLRGEIGAGNCLISRLDVTDPADFSRAISAFSDWTLGRMDVLFNSAGVLFQGFFASLPLEAHLKTIEVNFKGVVVGIQAAIPLLRNTPGACILTMSSASAVFGTPDHAVYSATKFAVRALTEALSIELAPSGIRVVDLMPSFVATPMLSDQREPSRLMTSMGINHRPEDIADWAWKAVHGRKLHWMTFQVRFADILGTLFPSLVEKGIRRQLDDSAATRKDRP